MKSYRGLTIRYLLDQKKRSFLTAVGIILSVALLCAAGIMGRSLQNMMNEEIKQNYGNFHVIYSGVSEGELTKIDNNIKVSKVGKILTAGLYKINDSKTLRITGTNKAFMDMIYYRLVSGRMPEKDNEIALEKWVLNNMKQRYKLGDTITLPYTPINMAKMGDKEMDLSKTVNRAFKLVGIFNSSGIAQFAGQSYGAVSIGTAKDMLKETNITLDAAVLFKDNLKLQEVIKETAASLKLTKDQVHQNNAVLALSAQSKDGGRNKAVVILQWIMMLIIIIATIAVIYNAFHISVLERIHQFGVLRSVGTTPKQIRTIVLGEAMILAFIGIPLGILCGILSMKGVIAFFAIRTTAFFGSMKVVISPNILIGTAILGLLTILISAYGPAVQAGRVSPLEAILNSSRQKNMKLKRKKHTLLKKLLGIEGVMAYENLKRNHKRFLITVFSMCIGIVLFIFFSAFMNFLKAGMTQSFHKDYAISGRFSSEKPGYTLKDYEDVTRLRGVKAVYRVMQKNEIVYTPVKETSGKYLESIKNTSLDYKYSDSGINYDGISAYLYGYRATELGLCKTTLSRGKIKYDAMNMENGVLVCQRTTIKNGDVAAATNLKVGDEILIKTPNAAKPVRLKIMGILDSMPLVYEGGAERYSILTTEEVYKKITGDNTFVRFDIAVDSAVKAEEMNESLKNIAARIDNGDVLDFNSSSQNEVELELSVILFGLVTVISIIGALNIINTISTNLILRTSEFGTLRAVGMTPGQLKKMIQMEGVFYGVISSFYGSIVGLGASMLLYNYLNVVRKITWHLPWQAMIEASIAATILGLIASAVPLKRVIRINVVESIKTNE